MIWICLILAVACEVGWAIAMKLSTGLTRPVPTIITLALYFLSVVFLALATRKLDIGVAYAMWAGSGVAIIAVIGVMYFKEPLTLLKAASLALIVAGIVGLQLSGAGSHVPAPAAARAP